MQNICFANSPETWPTLKKEELPYIPNNRAGRSLSYKEGVPSLVHIQLVEVHTIVIPGAPWLKVRKLPTPYHNHPGTYQPRSESPYPFLGHVQPGPYNPTPSWQVRQFFLHNKHQSHSCSKLYPWAALSSQCQQDAFVGRLARFPLRVLSNVVQLMAGGNDRWQQAIICHCLRELYPHTKLALLQYLQASRKGKKKKSWSEQYQLTGNNALDP